jgi:hypothetical protein
MILGYILFCSMIPLKVTFLNCVTGLLDLNFCFLSMWAEFDSLFPALTLDD